MNEPAAHRTIIVTGDITMDWNLARTRRSHSDQCFWCADDVTSTYWQRGGSALLADLVQEIAAPLEQNGVSSFSIRQTGAPRSSADVHPGNECYHHSYAIWAPYKAGEMPPRDREKSVWRVEEFLGLDRARTDAPQDWQRVMDDTSEADLVILDDSDLGIRNHEGLWPLALNPELPGPAWILLKMARPLARGPLWEHLHRYYSDRLIVVATVDDLRLSEVQISQELSWERTAQDVFWELVHNPGVNSLSHCRHVVISCGTAGAILLSASNRSGGRPFSCSLFFDPKVVERMWEQNHKGGMIGYNTCLAGGIARAIMLQPQQPDIAQGIQSGLSAIRALHLDGYGERGVSADRARLAFPTALVAGVLAQPSSEFSVAPVQDPMLFVRKGGIPAERPVEEGFWTILQDRYRNALHDVAARIVLEGPEAALQGVPLGQFGNLLTVDRREIESFRCIRSLVLEYARQQQVKRPLSIAVFGTPGSGKSFGVTEVARSLLPDQIETREFNLSQFDSVDNLLSALHQVRDISLSGRIPLVFWDEFDATLGGVPLGWLRYFLAPMQDGRFQEGQISHPIGRSIFVFAGGTAVSMAAFGQGLAPEQFRASKGPDFVSRLKGYINILGPNPVTTNGAADPYFILRRAILLRSSLKRTAPQLFEKRGGKDLLNIDHGVLRGLLKTTVYRHGARSIESLIAMSQLTNKTTFGRSSLPAESQLDLLVDGREFLSLVQEIELEGQVLENLARAAHQVFLEGLRSRGYVYGPTTDESTRAHAALRPYDELPEELKEQNRLNVRDIPVKLAAAGYIMIPARSNEPPFDFPGQDLERLAEAEHERWVQQKLHEGWAYSPHSDRESKLSDCIVPWNDLSEAQKQKDRDLVRGIPEILSRAGYAVVKSAS